jgi:hypothetical protein
MCLGIPSLYRGLRVWSIVDEPGSNAENISFRPALTVIHTTYYNGHDLTITLDRDTHELVSVHDTGSSYGGSGDIGVLFLGSPGIILFSPIVLLAWLIHLTIKGISGKETQYLILWHKLKGQLPTEVATELDIALSKQWKQHDRS